MEPFASLGVIGALFILFWAIVSLLVPFLIWGIYNQTSRSRKELEKIRALLESRLTDHRN